MTKQEAKKILSLYRPGTADEEDSEFAAALALARQDPELGRWFEAHCAVHNAIRSRFKQIAVPDGLKEQIISERDAHLGVIWWRRPTAWAAAAAVAVLVGIAAFWLRPDPDKVAAENFSTYRSRMVRAVLRAYVMEEAKDLNQIRTHLSERQAPTNYVLPNNLEKTAVAGYGVLNWQDRRVAMICFLTGKPLGPGEKSDLFLFVVDRSALPNPPNTGSPEIVRVSKLVTASWSVGDKTYVLATPGDEASILKYF